MVEKKEKRLLRNGIKKGGFSGIWFGFCLSNTKLSDKKKFFSERKGKRGMGQARP